MREGYAYRRSDLTVITLELPEITLEDCGLWKPYHVGSKYILAIRSKGDHIRTPRYRPHRSTSSVDLCICGMAVGSGDRIAKGLLVTHKCYSRKALRVRKSDHAGRYMNIGDQIAMRLRAPRYQPQCLAAPPHSEAAPVECNEASTSSVRYSLRRDTEVSSKPVHKRLAYATRARARSSMRHKAGSDKKQTLLERTRVVS